MRRDLAGASLNICGMLPAPPVVVDADVLLRNVDYQLRRGWPAALSVAATGTTVFAAVEVRAEVVKHLPDIASRRDVPLGVVASMWTEIASRIRFVNLSETAAEGDARLTTVDPKDLPTARLACVLAPAVLCTDARCFNFERRVALSTATTMGNVTVTPLVVEGTTRVIEVTCCRSPVAPL